MSPIIKKAAKKAVKFTIEKLLVPLPAALLGATLALYGNFLLEKYKINENFRLEKYKVDRSIGIYDSNEFIKRADLVWARADEFSAKVHELSGLYWTRNLHSAQPLNLKADILGINKERNNRILDLNAEIDRQRSIVKDAKREFYNTLFPNQFYLGEEISFQIALYVEMTHGLIQGEEMLDDAEKHEQKVDEHLSDFTRETNRQTDRLWEVALNVALEKVPNMREPDTEAHLPQDLQMIWDKKEKEERARQEQHDENFKKLREESITNTRKMWAENRKSIEEKLRKLRFDYAAARRYSLERKY